MTSLAVLGLASTFLQGSTIEPRLLRQPDIFGDTVVFVYAGDLWASNTAGGSVARRLASNVGARGGAATAPIVRPQISPDGKLVAFTANYDGSENIYVVPLEGGEPKRVTYSNSAQQPIGWTPDGRIAFITAEGNPYLGRQGQLLLVKPTGGVPERTAIKEIAAGSFFASGDKIAYNRVNSFNFNWRRYRGGTQGRISIYDLKTNEYKELPAKREQSYHPQVIGDAIFYISDKTPNGSLNLFKNVNGKDTQVTNFDDADIKWPNTDGTSIVFEKDGVLYKYDVKSNAASKINLRVPSENLAARPALKSLVQNMESVALSPSGARLAVGARGEVMSIPAKTGEVRNMSNSSGSREQSVDWSPDGKWISYMSDATGEYELYVQPQLGGAPTKLTSGLKLGMGYVWSPDSKKIVLTTIGTDVHILDVETKKTTPIDDFQYGGGSFTFSQDSKWVAYTKARENGYQAVHLYEVATGKSTKVTEGFFDDSNVCFDKGGKWLFVVSSRNFAPTFGRNEFSLKVDETDRLYAISLKASTPNPFLDKNDEEVDSGAARTDSAPTAPEGGVDLAGMDDRMIALPMGVGSYGRLMSADNGFFYVSNGVMFQYTMGAKAPTPIYEGVGNFSMNASHTKMAVTVPGGVSIVNLGPGANAQAASGRVDLSGVEGMINPREEWSQILHEVWRFQRDNFYDPNMGGVDWNAILKKYEAYLPWVNHRTDLNYVLGMMIGELGTGHAYVQAPGETGGVGSPRVQVGTLAADYKVVNGGVQIEKIARGSNDREATQTPLGTPGVDVKEGDFIVAIDGKPVNAEVDPNSLLLNKVGKYVTLSVNSRPSMDGARKVRVKPIGSDILARYYEYIEYNRKKVAELSGGRIGYMHISDTQAQGSSDFVRGFYSQTDKEAMIVDERWNGGGYIQPWFVETLKRTHRAIIQPRHGAHQPEAVTIEGPMAMLINQYAGSGGDFFPYMFKQAKRGPLIGKRTWGGLVGISGGIGLIDGGNVTSPNFAIYNEDTGEIIAENTGIDPDIDVDLRPDLVAKGEDPQIEAAVKYLMAELAKLPAKKPRTGVPKVSKPGKINP